MPNKLRKYRYKCTNNDWFETEYLTNLPTLCPDSHALDTDNITVLDQFTRDEILITDDDGLTQGYFLANGHTITATGGTGSVTTLDIVDNDFDREFYSMHLMPTPENYGDTIDVCTMPDTIVGVLTAEANASDTVLDVSSTVVDNLKLRLMIKVKNGGTVDDLGYVKVIDKTNSQITVTTAVTQTFPIGSFILGTVPRMNDIPLVSDQVIHFGENRTGGTYVKAGILARFHYNNLTGGNKKFHFYTQGTF